MHSLKPHIEPLSGTQSNYDALLRDIGNARVVLIGEASHGTHEFYLERARLTQRLIVEKGFNAVATEADWPDAWRVDRYVRGRPEPASDRTAAQALSGFVRFPAWMWRNEVVRDFVNWLMRHNAAHADAQVGYYGLDVYSLHASIARVIGYLERVDADAAARARQRYSCFDHHGSDPQSYGYLSRLSMSASCESAVLAQLQEMLAGNLRPHSSDGDAHFDAAHNARVVRNAEAYYRSMFGSSAESWNLRDRHMMETLEAVLARLDTGSRPGRVVVWAHNSHLGDARATSMGAQGELNLGQLVRERYGELAYSIGQFTYDGTVTAADNWGEAARVMQVRPGISGSYEELFHYAGSAAFALLLRGLPQRAHGLLDRRMQRAIGVIYRPRTELQSHYFQANLLRQFDAVLHFDRTRALRALDARQETGVMAEEETYPSGY